MLSERRRVNFMTGATKNERQQLFTVGDSMVMIRGYCWIFQPFPGMEGMALCSERAGCWLGEPQKLLLFTAQVSYINL